MLSSVKIVDAPKDLAIILPVRPGGVHDFTGKKEVRQEVQDRGGQTGNRAGDICASNLDNIKLALDVLVSFPDLVCLFPSICAIL